MPSPGLSLLGFMDSSLGIPYLLNACVPTSPDPKALMAEIAAAKAKLGPPIANAGMPKFSPIPASKQSHVDQCKHLPQVANYLSAMNQRGVSCDFQMVEIAPLLAYQFHVNTHRVETHCGVPTSKPNLDEIFEICLPLRPQSENIQASGAANSIILKTRALNFRLLGHGIFGNSEFAGIQIGISLPLVHVVRHNGLCYLHNGFHRTYGLGVAGVTEVPCLIRDVATYDDVGIVPGATFDAALLTSPNPPTLSHFIAGRAHPVSLRNMVKIITVHWSEHTMPDE